VKVKLVRNPNVPTSRLNIGHHHFPYQL